MKANIRKVGVWWKWDSYCDNCGEQIQDEHSGSSVKPEIGEEEYCEKCMKEIKDKQDGELHD